MSEIKSKSSGFAELIELPSGILNLQLGQSSESVITLTEARLNSIEEILLKLKKQTPKALIITGISEKMFTVGADINLIQSVTDAKEGAKLAKRGQAIFDLLESLTCIKVAAISGPCVGGGCELVLACDARIISDHPSSIIGLPEVKLGILPGFGGTQRLPRLIGLPKALDVILNAKTLRAKQALQLGLVDQVVKYDDLINSAEKLVQNFNKKSHIKLLDRILTFTKLGRLLVKSTTSKILKAKTKGFYPAPFKALNCCLFGLDQGLNAGYQKEAEELGNLIVSPECKALVNIFFLTESAKGLGKPAAKKINDLEFAVIGAGIMGAGIAASLIKNNYIVHLIDTSEASLTQAKSQIEKSIKSLKYLSTSDQKSLIEKLDLNQNSSLSKVNFVIEAIVEKLDIKQNVLTKIAKQTEKNGIIAFNTSSLSITKIADKLTNSENVLGMHFFNPVDKMPLVEIIRSEKTSDQSLLLTAALTTKLSKFPIIVSDVPGFLINRILSPYINEALYLLSEGYSIEQIDRIAKKFGMPMGPFRLLDKVGLDVASHVSQVMFEGYGKRMETPKYTNTLVAAGLKGEKTSLGFYDYSQKKEVVSTQVYELLNIKLAGKNVDLKAAEERLIYSLINEALLCLEQGVAGAPSQEAINQIDLGTVMGIGFPPFRGGVLYYAKTLGEEKITEVLSRLNKQFRERFTLPKSFKLSY